MARTLEEFQQVIANFTSIDNANRKRAEEIYEETKKNPDFLVGSLFQCIRSNADTTTRNLCCVLLRRAIGTSINSLWKNLSPQTQLAVKSQLLETLSTEQTEETRTQLKNVTTELAREILDEEGGEWPELLMFLFNLIKSPQPEDRETSLSIFAQLAEYLKETIQSQFQFLYSVLDSSLKDSNLKVKLAALLATSEFLHICEETERKHFQHLLPFMLETISAALTAKEEEKAQNALELFVEMAELHPVFLKPYLSQLLSACVAIMKADHLEDDTRHLALEFIATLCESRPAMVRKHPGFLETVIPLIVEMMWDIEDDEDWYEGNDEDYSEVDITDSDIGEETLDRLSIALGGVLLVPFMFNHIIPQLLAAQDWQKRHTGLMSISIMSEGCLKQMRPLLKDIVSKIIPFLRDPHPRIRWAACNCIGQMSSDFQSDFQEQLHSIVLPGLIAVMDDSANPRVQGHAAAAIINFCENASSKLLEPYLDPLLSKLYGLLTGGRISVQEQATTAIAAIADAAETIFTKYYDNFVPVLKSILANANGKEYRNLRGKTMECISLIGGAVGKEKFYSDAKEIMELMMNTQNAQLESDDPQIGFLLQSWARICKCMGQDFVPYLQYVMPPLLASASISPEVTVVENDDSADEVQQDGWQFVALGDKRIGINTSAMEEKATACSMIYCYVNELKEGFFPFVEEVSKILVPSMRYYFSSSVRTASWSAMPQLIASAVAYFEKSGSIKGAGEMYVRNLVSFILPEYLNSIEEEDELDTLILGLDSLAEVFDNAGPGILTREQLETVTVLCQLLIKNVGTRREEREKLKGHEDHDDDEEEKIEEDEERDQEVLGGIADIIGRLLKTYKEEYLVYFEQILPDVKALLDSHRGSDKQTAICIFDDLVEHLGLSSLKYFSIFLPILLPSITSAHAPLRQAAVYGAGLVAQHGGNESSQFIPELLRQLSNAITLSDAKDEFFVCPTENAICAVGKICLYQSSVVDTAKILPIWLSTLPVTEDKEESKSTYNLLCTFVEQ
eukprot:TRINITY_DN7083_c0_g1_i2.p1 TRINITY_DN7083_c0_g1~~TRINITY_DN7083_c0_g1_i2.p1  ORF type:complete len:1021 (-),score=279.53 TRINITY_DN7083_c0_g1_i2:1847-4909(-)